MDLIPMNLNLHTDQAVLFLKRPDINCRSLSTTLMFFGLPSILEIYKDLIHDTYSFTFKIEGDILRTSGSKVQFRFMVIVGTKATQVEKKKIAIIERKTNIWTAPLDMIDAWIPEGYPEEKKVIKIVIKVLSAPSSVPGIQTLCDMPLDFGAQRRSMEGRDAYENAAARMHDLRFPTPSASKSSATLNGNKRGYSQDTDVKEGKMRFADEDQNDEEEESQNEDKENDSESMDTTEGVTTASSMDRQKLEDIPVPPLPSSLPAGPPPRLPQGPLSPVKVMCRPPPLRTAIPPLPCMLPPGVPPPPPGRPTLTPPGIPLRLGTPPIRPPGPRPVSGTLFPCSSTENDHPSARPSPDNKRSKLDLVSSFCERDNSSPMTDQLVPDLNRDSSSNDTVTYTENSSELSGFDFWGFFTRN